MLELPTGSSRLGLGNGQVWARLPLWVQKSYGKWMTYGGAGYQITIHYLNKSQFRSPEPKCKPEQVSSQRLCHSMRVYLDWLLQREPKSQESGAIKAVFSHSPLAALGPLNNFEFNAVSLLQSSVSLAYDCCVVDKYIRPVIASNEAVAFRIVEPFDLALHAALPRPTLLETFHRASEILLRTQFNLDLNSRCGLILPRGGCDRPPLIFFPCYRRKLNDQIVQSAHWFATSRAAGSVPH